MATAALSATEEVGTSPAVAGSISMVTTTTTKLWTLTPVGSSGGAGKIAPIL